MNHFEVEIKGFTTFHRSFREGRTSLSAIGKTSRPIEIKNEDGLEYSFSELEVHFFLKESTSSQFFIIVESKYEENRANLILNVESEEFEELKNSINQGICIFFDISEPLIFKENSFQSKVEIIDIYSQWSVELVHELLNWRLNQSRYVAGNEHSQASLIAEELLKSFEILSAKDSKVAKNRSEHLDELDHLFDSFRQSVPRPLENYEILRSYTVDDFMVELNKVDEASRKDLLKAYNTFWASKESLRYIIFEQPFADDTGELNVEVVDEVAFIYLKSGLVSPHLEWLIIDALLFAETMATYRAFHHEFPRKFKNSLLHEVDIITGSLWNEATYLIVTFFISLSAQSQWWLLFTIITAIRWGVPNHNRENRKERFKLIISMAGAQKRTTSKWFNSQLVLQQLYALEQRGAVFSQFVYNLLDKRITRENFNGRLNRFEPKNPT